MTFPSSYSKPLLQWAWKSGSYGNHRRWPGKLPESKCEGIVCTLRILVSFIINNDNWPPALAEWQAGTWERVSCKLGVVAVSFQSASTWAEPLARRPVQTSQGQSWSERPELTLPGIGFLLLSAPALFGLSQRFRAQRSVCVLCLRWSRDTNCPSCVPAFIHYLLCFLAWTQDYLHLTSQPPYSVPSVRERH